MILGLFKKKSADKSKEQGTKISKEEEERLAREQKIIQMKASFEKLEQVTKLGYIKLEKRQNEVRETMKIDKKKARAQLAVLKKHMEELEKLEKMKMILEKSIIESETQSQTSLTIDALKISKTLAVKNEENLDFMNEYAMEYREMESQGKEMGNILNQMAYGDDEEQEDLDKLYKQFENEIADDKMNDILLSNNPKKVSIKMAQQKKVQEEEDLDDVDAIMKKALSYV